MLRSMFTAISGLDAQQQMLDVTSNNIANSNTTGFKASSTEFESALSQTLSSGGSSLTNNSVGGTNATQIGLGVRLASTNQDFTEGSAQATGIPSNLMINGDGFFMVSRGGQTFYTRAGGFTLDGAGHLVNTDGAEIENTTGQPLDLSALNSGTYESYSIDQNGNVNAVDSAGNSTLLGQIGLATFANPDGLVQVGDTEWSASASSGAAQLGAPNSTSFGSLSSGYVEMSNTDLSTELTNLIVAERGFQADSKVISTSDTVLQTLVNMTQG
jgi:flagellar hook protein FlgE